MNKDIFQGKWHEIKGQLRSQWGKLTDNDIEQIEGNNEELFGFLQKHYGLERQAAEKEIEKIIKH